MEGPRYTPEEMVAAARWMREQACRLPHAQRRAVNEMTKLFEGGADLSPKLHPEFGDVGGSTFVSIPVFWSGRLLGSVDIAIMRSDPPTSGEEWVPVHVVPMYTDDFFTPLDQGIEEEVFVKAPDLHAVEDDPKFDRRVDPSTGLVFTKCDEISTDTLVAITDGQNERIVMADAWNMWTSYQGDE